jgi:hypothetical protein
MEKKIFSSEKANTFTSWESSLILVAGIISGSISGYFVAGWLLKEIYHYQLPPIVISVAAGALLIFSIGILVTNFIREKQHYRNNS